MRWSASVAIVLMTAGLAAQQAGTVDQQRSAWRFRRDVTRPPDAEDRLWAVPVPPEVQARGQQRLSDLRLVNRDGREAAFLVLEDAPRLGERRWSGTLSEARQERRRQSTWTVDFGSMITFDRLDLDIPAGQFSKRLDVEASSDGEEWRAVEGDFWVFDRVWQAQTVHDTTLTFPVLDARFIRLRADDRRSRPVEVAGAVAVRTDRLDGSSWSDDLPLDVLGTSDGRTRYRIPAADGHPVRRLAIDADDPAFARRISIVEQRGTEEHVAGSGQVYRLRLPDASLNVDAREVAVTRQLGGSLIVEVTDGDNPPLVNPRVRLSGPQTLLVTSTPDDDLILYYGNSVTRAAVYDLEQLRTAIALVPEYPIASIGDETENPAYRQPAPLEFVAARGAVVDPEAWQFVHPVRITGVEDLYTAVVAPADRARLRRDLGDLRLVDEANRQVPYVVEAEAESALVALTIEPTEPRQKRPQVSAYRLTSPAAGPGADPLRFSGLRLRFAERFFQRDVEILVPRAGAPLGRDVVASSRLAVPGEAGIIEPAWMPVTLNDVAARELVVEIADRDNAPLTLLQAQGVVPVPRITFKATPGDYRLLLGNADASPPSYELGALRREVLAYSAVPLELDDDATDANPAFSQGLSGLLRQAPPAAILWIALGIAVIVLLALTRRILSRTT